MDTAKKQALLITTQTEFAKIIRTILANNSIEINNRYEALSSPAVIRKAYQSTGNTVFVRKAFSRFIAEQGAPFIVIIDYRIFLTSDLRDDPDMRKIIKTLLISYIIMNSESNILVPANFVLIDVGEKGSGAMEVEKNPASLLDIISTDNQEINAMVRAYKKDPGKFNSTFRFMAVSPKSSYNEVKVKFDDYLARISGIASNDEISQENQITAQSAEQRGKFSAECTVILKTDSGHAIANCIETTVEPQSNYSALPEKHIHLLGYWGKENFQDIAKKIRETIEMGFAKKLFDENGGIVLNLSRNCTVEPSVMGFLVSLAHGDFSGGREVKILIDFKNSVVLEKAPGYRLISKNVFHCF